MVQSWYEIILDSLGDLLGDFFDFLPNLIVALIVILVGWLISIAIGRIVTEILRRIKFNKLFDKGVWKNALAKAKWKVDPSGFIGALVKWVLFIAILVPAVEILGFTQFTVFISKIAAWLPNLIIATAIFVVATIVAEYLPKVIRAGVEGMKMRYGGLLESIIRWAIWIFAVLAILMQLGIASELITILFTGFVAFLAIAGGLAFGLGGKETASEFLNYLKRKFREE